MATSQQSQTTTRMFARVMGPFIVVIDGAAVMRAPEIWERFSHIASDPLWTWVAGAFTLLAGLVVVGLHPYWRGAAAVAVSVVGWLGVIKGFFLVMFPDVLLSIPESTAGAIGWWRVLYVGLALVGLYLSQVGWAPGARRPATRDNSPSSQLPHAA